MCPVVPGALCEMELLHFQRQGFTFVKNGMKKLFVLVLLSLQVCAHAQWFEASATGGAEYFKISAGITNSVCGVGNIGVAIVKAKVLDFGVQFTATTKLTIATTMSPGIFADIVLTKGDNVKNIFTIGGHGNYVNYGPVKVPGAYYKNGDIDTVATKIDHSLSYGIRLGYKRQLAEHIYLYVLANVTYTEVSTIHYGETRTNNIAVLSLPLMVGIAARF
jgi:hypothetical protein